jgi:hypothetical protein
MGPRVLPPRPEPVKTYERDGRVYPYDERVRFHSRSIDVVDLLTDNGVDVDAIDNLKQSARKHFELLNRRELPGWKFDSMTTATNWGEVYGLIYKMDYEEYLNLRWLMENPDEVLTRFRPGGLFRKAYREKPEFPDVPIIDTLEFRFKAYFHSNPYKADYIDLRS